MENITALLDVDWGTILQQVLVILGAASVLAKITPWKWDNAILDAIQNVINKVGLSKE